MLHRSGRCGRGSFPQARGDVAASPVPAPAAAEAYGEDQDGEDDRGHGRGNGDPPTESEHGGDENSDRGDWEENGNIGEDVNMDVDDDTEENNSEFSNEDYISQLILGSHNAHDYYGESDTETDLKDESVDAPDFGESQSSVNMSKVRKKNRTHA
ncbi:hypothetical protein ZWY2020_019823 [Hordeum vulgare]|nr:hypothetical protein ZWY2020_019823 [Hordeum vulgare]